jgi:uncharacterized protein YjaG (DUF416 family)
MNKVSLPDYDEKATLRKLKELTPRSRTAFALAVATRLLPGYHRFHLKTGRGDSALLEALIEKLWMDISHLRQMKLGDLEASAAQALACVPGEESGWDQETQAYAEDAASALAYAYRARLTGNPQEAAWATRCALETVEFFMEQQSIAAGDFQLVRAELDRQARDILDLETWEMREFDSELLRELRARSERDAARVLQLVQE